MNDVEKAAAAIIKRGQRDPVHWIETFLDVKLWQKQKEICYSVRDNRNTSVKACHGPGKSFVASCIVLWFLCNHRPSIVLTTATRANQVRHVLWKEIAQRYKNALVPIGGELLTQKLTFDTNHFALGFTSHDYDPTGFQGYHEYYLLAVLDEAGGVTAEVQAGVAGVLTSPAARKLSIGNPTDPTAPFANDFKPGARCSKISISVFDTPNFTEFGIGPKDMEHGTWPKKLGLDMSVDDPMLDKACEGVEWPNKHLVTPMWCHEKMIDWGGLESPLAYSKIWGQFPQDSTHSLIKLRYIEQAKEHVVRPKKKHLRVFACDVARFGDDSTVIVERWEQRIRVLDKYEKEDTMATANRLAAIIKDTAPDRVQIDDDGCGGGVVDRLREMQRDGDLDQLCKIIRVRNAATPKDPELYTNVRDEAYGLLKKAFEAGVVDIEKSGEYADAIEAELQAIKYKFVNRGRLKIEPKADLKKRLKRSPDLADAIAYAYAEPIEEPELFDVDGGGFFM